MGGAETIRSTSSLMSSSSRPAISARRSAVFSLEPCCSSRITAGEVNNSYCGRYSAHHCRATTPRSARPDRSGPSQRGRCCRPGRLLMAGGFNSTGIRETILRFEEAILSPCPSCGADSTADVQCGIIGRTINIAAATTKFKLVPNGPRPGRYFCNSCQTFFDPGHRRRPLRVQIRVSPVWCGGAWCCVAPSFALVRHCRPPKSVPSFKHRGHGTITETD